MHLYGEIILKDKKNTEEVNMEKFDTGKIQKTFFIETLT